MGLVVRGILRGAGRMLGMEIQAPAGEEGAKPERVGTHGSGVWDLGREGREIRAQGPGGSPGLGWVRMRAVSGRSPHIEEEAAPVPPPYLPPTFSSPARLSAKAAQNPGLDFPPKSWAGFLGTWTHLLHQSSPLP